MLTLSASVRQSKLLNIAIVIVKFNLIYYLCKNSNIMNMGVL